MRATRFSWVPVVALGLLSPVAQARGKDDAAVLARQLASTDAAVRRCAFTSILVDHGGDADALLAALETAGAPRDDLARVREARRLSAALAAAPKDGLPFWSLLERLMGPEWSDLEPAIVLAAGVSPERRATWHAQRDQALAVVARFCARGTMPATFSDAAPAPNPPAPPAKPPADPVADELIALGARAVPHLLRALASDPWTSFWGRPGGTFALTPPAALEQGGAIVAVARLGAREAIPYLLFQLHGPSVTLESNAAAALARWSGQKIPFEPGRSTVDDTAVFAWWEAERRARPQEVRDFVEAVLTALLDALPFLDLMPSYAETYAKYDQPVGTTFAALERIAGRSLGPVPSGSLEARLRGIRAALAAERARPADAPGGK